VTRPDIPDTALIPILLMAADRTHAQYVNACGAIDTVAGLRDFRAGLSANQRRVAEAAMDARMKVLGGGW
jgi:hypothetical protein